MAIYKSYTPITPVTVDPDAPIVLRDEQRKAVNDAKKYFKGKTGKKFLWNAKMRFGKTISALQLARELDTKRVLIVTHRPVVDANFREDFDKVFRDVSDKWTYASRSDTDGTGEVATLEKKLAADPEQHYVFFASMQYLCRSNLVNKKDNADSNPLKHDILNNEWNLIVVDEAHEGTTGDTQGHEVVKYLSGKKGNVLHLSGTPFNLYDDFADSEIYTWDYIQEQTRKQEFIDRGVPDTENPYITLPKMNIFTYDLAKLRGGEIVKQGAQFTLSEFFRTWTGNRKIDHAEMPEGAKGKFVHEDAVNSFLDMLCSEDEQCNYPFSKEEYQDNFHHTLWVVPGVKEAKALAELLRKHPTFGYGNFEIVNVSGNGDEDEQASNALDQVKKKIGDRPEQTYTITISCGRLTTGVTVPEWTAVFYLKGSDNTSAATYMQTIFRVQSSHVYGGKMKAECYVFDFAPDRLLRAVAETAKFYNLTAKERKFASHTSKDSDMDKLRQFISFCPVISLDGGQMVAFDEHKLFNQLNSIYIERVVKSGFTDNALFNKNAIMQMDSEALNVLDGLDAKERNFSKGKGKSNGKLNISENDLRGGGGAPDGDDNDNDSGKTGKHLTDEEKARRKAQRDELENRRAKLRDITIRIPLLIFGGNFEDDDNITLDNFTRKVDDRSWVEFMPKGLTKTMFNQVKSGINGAMFIEAGKFIRRMTREADQMHIEDRIAVIADIHERFHNPSKETVLTPWRVVNMHLSDTLGGYTFFNESFTGPNQKEVYDTSDALFEYVDTRMPRFVSQGDVTRDVFGSSEECHLTSDQGQGAKDLVEVFGKGSGRPDVTLDKKILEINSKTGLYPLYATYSLYRNRLKDYADAGLLEDPENLSFEEEQVVWEDVLQNNIYIISNTRMAEAITRRTLYGFRDLTDTRLHIKNEPIVEQAKEDTEGLAKKLRSVGFWNGTTSKEMLEFTAVIGNPPYMITSEANNKQTPIYQYFYDVAEKLSNIYSLISPARFLFNAGLTPKEWNQKMLEDIHLKVAGYYSDSSVVFPSTNINGGVAIIYRNQNEVYNSLGMFIPNDTLRLLAGRFANLGSSNLTSIGFGGRSDLKFNEAFLENYPNTPQHILSYLQREHPEITTLAPNEEFELKSSSFKRTPYAFTSDRPQDPTLYYRILGIENGVRTWKWVLKKYLSPRYPNNNNIEGYKVFISKADGAAGQIGKPIPARILGTPEIGLPSSSSTASFISLGNFKTESEARNLAKYLQTQFARVLLGILKVTQDFTPGKFEYVPLQDFTDQSDIDWSKSIEEIDEQLFDKYGLNQEERNFINKMIKPIA